MRKKVLIIGGRSESKSLVDALVEQGYRITMISNDNEDNLRLSSQRGVRVINGDGTRPFVLEEAGAHFCDISISLTSRDEDNLVASELCKKMFGVPKTVTVISDPKKTEFFRRMGVDCVVCAVSTITNIIEHQAFIDEMTNFIPIGEGRVQIIEVQIPSESPVNGKKLWEISLPDEVIIGCVLRGDATIIPRGDTRILAGDTLVIISASGQETTAIKVLIGR